jgi:TetR/AcrR family transcriptional regulator
VSASDAKRDQILMAAIGVFGRYGYRRTSMDQIARAAGISRPSLYAYFTGKEDMFRAVGGLLLTEVLDAAERARDAGGDVEQRLYDALSIKLEMVVGTVDADFRSELLTEAGEIAADLLADFKDRYATVVAELLRTAADRLDLLDVEIPAPDCAVLLLDAVTGVASSHDALPVLQRRLRQLVRLTLRGLSTVDGAVPAR